MSSQNGCEIETERAPIFSIIVVSYNAERYIRETINSILCQTFEDFEIIVKDACSTDGTLEQIPKDNRIKVYSKKDDGIYHGMNEAIEYAKGEYIFFLNCGDLFYENKTLENIYCFARKHILDNQVIYGDVANKGSIRYSPQKISRFFLYRNTLCHQCAFFKRSLFDEYGNLDTTYKIAADYEMFVRLLFADVKFTKIDCAVCKYLGDGVSESNQGEKINSVERKKIICRYYSLIERMKYGFIMLLTLRRLRILMSSDKAPSAVNKMYIQIVNRRKKKQHD